MQIKHLKITTILTLSLIFTLPYVFNPFFNTPESFESIKSIYFSLFVLLILVTYLVEVRFKIIPALKTFLSIRYIQLLVSIFIVAILNSAFGFDFLYSILGNDSRKDGLIFMISLILFLYLLIQVSSNKGYELVIKATIYSAIGLCILGFLQYFLTALDLLSTDYLYDGRMTSTFGQANYFASYILVTLPLLWTKVGKNLKFRKYIISILVISIFLTFSKATILGTLLMFIYLYWKQIPKWILLASIGILTGLIFLSLSGSLFGIYEYVNSKPELYQVQRMIFFTSPYNQVGSIRVDLITTGLQSSLDNKLIGFGVSNIDIAYEPIQEKYLETHQVIVNSSHNIFLDNLIELGLLGLILLIWFYIDIFTIKSNNKDTKIFKLAIALLLFRGIFQITPPSLLFMEMIMVGLISFNYINPTYLNRVD